MSCRVSDLLFDSESYTLSCRGRGNLIHKRRRVRFRNEEDNGNEEITRTKIS